MFQHYLITRFNLRNPKWDVTKNNETLLTEKWMEHRMGLFADFCFPSVAAQTNTNFTWLLYFDNTTPKRFQDQIAEMIEGKAHIRIFFIDGMPAFYPEIKKLIASEAREQPYLITSRIDNDDCIHKNFIDEVQKQFKSQDYQAIDVIRGYSLQVKPTVMLGKKEHIFNPFISLIEKNAPDGLGPKTVWFSDHNMWKKETRITRVTHMRLWMSIIHEKNKVNEFDGYANVKWEDLRHDFVVSPAMDSLILKSAIAHKEWRYLSFRNRLYVKMVLFSKMLKKALGIYRFK